MLMNAACTKQDLSMKMKRVYFSASLIYKQTTKFLLDEQTYVDFISKKKK